MLVAGSRLTFSMLLHGAMGKSSEAGMPCEKGILRHGRCRVRRCGGQGPSVTPAGRADRVGSRQFLPDKARADMNVTEHVHQAWRLLQFPDGEQERVTEQSAGCYAWSAVEAVAV